MKQDFINSPVFHSKVLLNGKFEKKKILIDKIDQSFLFLAFLF